MFYFVVLFNLDYFEIFENIVFNFYIILFIEDDNEFFLNGNINGDLGDSDNIFINDRLFINNDLFSEFSEG